MADIQFYHLVSPLEQVLPKLLEKSLQGGFRTLVKLADSAQAERMNEHLWTYSPDSFMPHGTAKDGHSDTQPIYLSCGEENPNHASLVVVTDGSQLMPDAAIKRVLDLIDAGDEKAVAEAHKRQVQYASEGHNVSAVRQTAAGGWEKPAA